MIIEDITTIKNFNPKFDVASCIIEYDGKILFLKRQKNKPQPNKYSLPAGKIENDESVEDGIIREVFEETGINLKKDKVKYLKKRYVQYTNYQFIYHSFFYKLDNMPIIKINEVEDQEYKWVDIKEVLSLDLIQDEDKCLEEFINNICINRI
jgi:8-oxo-dGTP pyrophosphatase MutT (NUDIX family)